MNADVPRLGRATGSFALAATIAIIFNTVVAWVKDFDKPFKTFMTSLAGHDWTTQGIADVILFVAVGLLLWRTRLSEKVGANTFVYLLGGATIAAGAGLFIWYAIF